MPKTLARTSEPLYTMWTVKGARRAGRSSQMRRHLGQAAKNALTLKMLMEVE